MKEKKRLRIRSDITSILPTLVSAICFTLFSCSLVASQQTDRLTVATTVQPNSVVEANDQISFKITPDYTPKFRGAEIVLDVAQVRLLRKEAITVQVRIHNLKAKLSMTQPPPRRDQLITILRESLNEGLKDVQRTERSFNDLSRAIMRLTGEVFFDDLQSSYRHALEDLTHAQAQSQVQPRLQTITLKDEPRYPALAQGALRVLEQNELAYSVVANEKDLTFNLEVNSVPAGASVFFWRRGDSERKNSKPTNSTVTDLPYAIWFVRFQLPGYKEEELEHDPFREPNHVLNVELHKQ